MTDAATLKAEIARLRALVGEAAGFLEDHFPAEGMLPSVHNEADNLVKRLYEALPAARREQEVHGHPPVFWPCCEHCAHGDRPVKHVLPCEDTGCERRMLDDAHALLARTKNAGGP